MIKKEPVYSTQIALYEVGRGRFRGKSDLPHAIFDVGGANLVAENVLPGSIVIGSTI